jgi:hypothetical protein
MRPSTTIGVDVLRQGRTRVLKVCASSLPPLHKSQRLYSITSSATESSDGGRWTSVRYDHGDPSANQLGRQRRQPVKLILRPAVLDRHVLALDIAGVFQALAKCTQLIRDCMRRSVVEKSNHRHRRLLRVRCAGPCCRPAAKKRDELAPPHVSPQPLDKALYRLKGVL